MKNQAYAQAMRTIDAQRPRPVHSFWSTTGEGGASVECLFNMSQSGEVEDLQVEYLGMNVVPVLTAAQVTVLEWQCRKDYEEQNERSYWESRIAASEDRTTTTTDWAAA